MYSHSNNELNCTALINAQIEHSYAVSASRSSTAIWKNSQEARLVTKSSLIMRAGLITASQKYQVNH